MSLRRLVATLIAAALVAAIPIGAHAQRGQVEPYVDTIQPPFRLPPPPADPFHKIYPPPARPEPVPQRSQPIPQPYPGGQLAPGRTPLLPEGFSLTIRRAGDGLPGDVALSRPQQIGERLAACWRPPVARSSSEATVRLSFTRAGAVTGEPRVVRVRAGGGASRAAVRNSVLAAVRRCAPLRFTPALGSAISGRPFTLRFVAPARAKAR